MNRIFILLLIVMLIGFSSDGFAQKGEAKAPTAVIVSRVSMTDFADRVEALGTVKANEHVEITADLSEKIAEIHFEDGQFVKQDDLLVTLDKTQEEAELRVAQAILAERQSAYDRAKGLSGNSALPKATLEERSAELRQAQAAFQALQASMESYEITAPFDGVLGLREMSVGTLVQPGDKITTIDDLSQMKVDFDVPSVFLQSLKENLPITGYVEAFGDRAFKGVVHKVDTQIDPITRTVTVRAIIPNEDGVLKPGLLMRINMFQNARKALLMPEEALIKRSNKNLVFVVVEQDGKMMAQQTPITIGARSAGMVEVISGLNEGDKVVTHGTLKMNDGAEVTIRAEENENTPLDVLLEQKTAPQTQDTQSSQER